MYDAGTGSNVKKYYHFPYRTVNLLIIAAYSLRYIRRCTTAGAVEPLLKQYAYSSLCVYNAMKILLSNKRIDDTENNIFFLNQTSAWCCVSFQIDSNARSLHFLC